jgi:hypothetical protein
LLIDYCTNFTVPLTVELLAHNFVIAVLCVAVLVEDDTEVVETCVVDYFWAYPLLF